MESKPSMASPFWDLALQSHLDALRPLEVRPAQPKPIAAFVPCLRERDLPSSPQLQLRQGAGQITLSICCHERLCEKLS